MRLPLGHRTRNPRETKVGGLAARIPSEASMSIRSLLITTLVALGLTVALTGAASAAVARDAGGSGQVVFVYGATLCT